jgi:hypothetical protein
MIALLICSAAVSAAASSGISKERFLQKKVMSMKGSDAEVVYKKHHGNHTKPEESIGLTEKKKKHKKHKGAETKADMPTKKNHHKKHNPTNETETNSIEEPGIIEKEHHMTTHQKNHTKAIDKDTILIEKVAEKDGLKVKEILHKHGPKNSIAEMIMHEKEAETRASSSNVVESVVAKATAQEAEVEAESIEIVMAQQQSMISSATTSSIWISCMVGLVSMMC